jgi:hypothetical protein
MARDMNSMDRMDRRHMMIQKIGSEEARNEIVDCLTDFNAGRIGRLSEDNPYVIASKRAVERVINYFQGDRK